MNTTHSIFQRSVSSKVIPVFLEMTKPSCNQNTLVTTRVSMIPKLLPLKESRRQYHLNVKCECAIERCYVQSSFFFDVTRI